MDNPVIAIEKTGRVVVDGLPYPFYVEKGELPSGQMAYYLARSNHASKSFAWHARRKDLIAAMGVFIEGATKSADESEADCVKRALQLCLETGSRHVVLLSKEVMPVISDEYSAGLAAQQAEVKWWQNPHASGSVESYQWDCGHTAGRRIEKAYAS